MVEKDRPVGTEWGGHRHLTDVWRGAAVEHAHIVGGGSIPHPRQPALEDRDVGVSGLGSAHLLSDMVLLDGPQPPLLVGGEEVLPERVTLRRPTRLREVIPEIVMRDAFGVSEADSTQIEKASLFYFSPARHGHSM